MKKILIILVTYCLISCNRMGVSGPGIVPLTFINSKTDLPLDSAAQVTFWFEIEGDSLPLLYDQNDSVTSDHIACGPQARYDIKYVWSKNLSFEVYQNPKINKFYINFAGKTDTLYFSSQGEGFNQNVVPKRLNDQPIEIYRDCNEGGLYLIRLSGGAE
jgi:hypothetical protein